MIGNKFDKNKTKKSYRIKNNLCEIIEGNYYKRFKEKYRAKDIKHKKTYFTDLINNGI